MKKLITILLLLFVSGLTYAQTTINTIGNERFLMKDGTSLKRATAQAVRSLVNHGTKILFKITQTDSTNLAKTLIYSEFNDTLAYTLVRDTGSVGVFKLNCTNGTPFTTTKTKVNFSNGQGTGKVYFSSANTSTSRITLYSYLQTSDDATDAGFGSAGTYVEITVFP